MERLKLRTWWQKLGLNKSEANTLTKMIDKKPVRSVPVNYYVCKDCSQAAGRADFHDCIGKFDELRLHLSVATNSVRFRLKKKYGQTYVEDSITYISNLPLVDYTTLNQEYLLKLEECNKNDSTLVLEEELWAS
jgi:hypothetical protein